MGEGGVGMRIRRVVTGQSEAGAGVLRDEEVSPITVALIPGAEFHRIWGSDATPEIPAPTSASEPRDWFPPAGGFRFGFVTLPPAAAATPGDLDMAAALGELSDKLPGFIELMEPDSPGMHTSDTVDVVLIVSGQATLQLGDGPEVNLAVGDCVVQNGTRHAWRNPTSEPCTMAVAIVGARRTA
jgi:mannose-6-phosphate isomerase-like protein (cupin superfamily)